MDREILTLDNTFENTDVVYTFENMDEFYIFENTDEVDTSENIDEADASENIDEVDTSEKVEVFYNEPAGRFEDLIIAYDEIDIEVLEDELKDVDEDKDYDPYGAQETIRRLREERGLDDSSRAIAIYNDLAEKYKEEELRKKEKARLYKSDKKCYNISKDGKNCQKDKTENRIETFINIRLIRKDLKYNDITYADLAKELKISERTVKRKLNLYVDLTANELVIISRLLNKDINDYIYENKH